MFRATVLAVSVTVMLAAGAIADEEESGLIGSYTEAPDYSDAEPSEPAGDPPPTSDGEFRGYQDYGKSTVTFPGEGGGGESGDGGGVRSAQ